MVLNTRETHGWRVNTRAERSFSWCPLPQLIYPSICGSPFPLTEIENCAGVSSREKLAHYTDRRERILNNLAIFLTLEGLYLLYSIHNVMPLKKYKVKNDLIGEL